MEHRVPQRPATRADVARLAGVSTAVVSYVVNDGPRPVADQTRSRVQEAIQTLGYRPNASARALKRGGTGLLGLMVSEIINPFHAECINALDAAAARRDYSLLLASAHNDVGREARQFSNLVDRGIEGLVFLSTFPEQSAHREMLRADGLPHVIFDRSVPAPGFSTVGANARQGAFDAVRHLREHGHRAIAYIEGELNPVVGDERRVGWERALAADGIAPTQVATTSWDRQGGADAARRLMSSAHPPTAIFAGSDLMAIGALQALHALGLSVPQDVAVISFDGTAEAEYSWPPLSTVQHPYEQLADAAIDMLLDPAGGPRAQLFDMRLIPRASCGCASAPTARRD